MDRDVPLRIAQRETLNAIALGDRYSAAYEAVMAHDAERALAALTCPVLVFAGTRDVLYPQLDAAHSLLANGSKTRDRRRRIACLRDALPRGSRRCCASFSRRRRDEPPVRWVINGKLNMDQLPERPSRPQSGCSFPPRTPAWSTTLQKVRLDGLTWHPSRIWIEIADWADESERSGDDFNTVFERFLDALRVELPISIRNILSARITHLMLGMSAETFWGGLDGNVAFEQGIQDRIGDLGLTTGAGATRDALHRFGAKKISVITPYPPIGDDKRRAFFSTTSVSR